MSCAIAIVPAPGDWAKPVSTPPYILHKALLVVICLPFVSAAVVGVLSSATYTYRPFNSPLVSWYLINTSPLGQSAVVLLPATTAGPIGYTVQLPEKSTPWS